MKVPTKEFQDGKKTYSDGHEINKRKQCQVLYLSGKSVCKISTELHRSRKWVYKWVKRSKSDDKEWYKSQSRRPHTSPNKILTHLEAEVVNSRINLQKRDTPETKYSFCGAVGIHQDLDKKGIDNKPSLSSINRIIKRHGLVESTQKALDIGRKKIYYPVTNARYPNYLHQLDIITPLYISGYGKVISVNRIDVFTSHANLNQFNAKNSENILTFIIEDWKQFGIPRYLQVDNEAAFRGGLYHPRTFGRLVRFCLNFGVQMIFIPYNEPWRNSHIESLNGRFQKLVWNSNRFQNLHEFRIESVKFRKQHNNYQSYRSKEFRNLIQRPFTKTFLPESFLYDVTQKLPITTGNTHFIRQVDENGQITIFNETIFVSKQYCFEYIWTVLNTREQSLSFYYKENKNSAKRLIGKKEYKIREKVKNRVSVKKFV